MFQEGRKVHLMKIGTFEGKKGHYQIVFMAVTYKKVSEKVEDKD